MRSDRVSRGFRPTIDPLDVKAVPSDLNPTLSAPPSALGQPAAVGVNDSPAETNPYLSTFTEVDNLAGPVRPFNPTPTITPGYLATPTMNSYLPAVYDPNGIEVVDSYTPPVWYPNLNLAD